MNKRWRKKTALLLVIAMMLSFMPLAWASTEDTITADTNGEAGVASSPSALQWENSVIKIDEDGGNGSVDTAIYLDGVNGDDDCDGLSADKAVKTFAKAAELAMRNGVSTVYVTSTVTVEDEQTWGGNLTLVRENNFTDGALVAVAESGKLILKDIIIDGNHISVVSSNMYQPANLLRVEGSLSIADGVVIRNHVADASGGQRGQYCAAVFVYSGTLNMSGGEICNNTGGNFRRRYYSNL